MYLLNAQKLQNVPRSNYQRPPWEFLPIHGSRDLYQRIPPQGGGAPGSRCNSQDAWWSEHHKWCRKGEPQEPSFTTLGAGQDNIYMSSLDSHVSLYIYQSDMQRKIQNKPQQDVCFLFLFSNYNYIILAASREFRICEVTAISLRSP